MTGTPDVARERDNAPQAIFGRKDRVLIGVVHLWPLPGSPNHGASEVEPIYRRALADARPCRAAGFDGLIVENHGDIPFAKPTTSVRRLQPTWQSPPSHPARDRFADRRQRARERDRARVGGRKRRRANSWLENRRRNWLNGLPRFVAAGGFRHEVTRQRRRARLLPATAAMTIAPVSMSRT